MKIPINPDNFPKLPGVKPILPPAPDFPPGLGSFVGDFNLPETESAVAALVSTDEMKTESRDSILKLYTKSLSDNSDFEISQEYETVKNQRQRLEFMARTPEMDKLYQALTEVESVLHELSFNNPFGPQDPFPDFHKMPGAEPMIQIIADNQS